MLRAGSRASFRIKQEHGAGADVWCKCLWPYKASYDGDLAMTPDDMIKVTDPHYDEGWWEGINTRTQLVGIFPINHVERCDGPQAGKANNPSFELAGRLATGSDMERGGGSGGGGGGTVMMMLDGSSTPLPLPDPLPYDPLP